jgi:hypothetical protein
MCEIAIARVIEAGVRQFHFGVEGEAEIGLVSEADIHKCSRCLCRRLDEVYDLAAYFRVTYGWSPVLGTVAPSPLMVT